MKEHRTAAQEPKPFARRLREARKAAGISASGLSKAVKASRSLVYQLETGRIHDVTATLIFRFADAIGARVEWLMNGEGKAPTPEASRAAFAKVSPTPARTATRAA